MSAEQEAERLRAHLGAGWRVVSREVDGIKNYGVDFRRGDVVLCVWLLVKSVMVGVYLEREGLDSKKRPYKIREYVLSFVNQRSGRDVCVEVEELLRIVQTRLKAVLDVVDASFGEVHSRDLVSSR